jgi:hypothetical protein
MANINIGAVLLTGIVVVGGAMIGGISRLLNGGSFIEVSQGWPFKATRNKQQKREYLILILILIYLSLLACVFSPS